ncbi:hypothetical protein BKA67DRAFT_655670 [Truncatella angustata]|uniref:SWIRM domain-containing protein n=1 Tax=Truncatella angustata TaxID=152316 RepID=A0A9P9A1Q2_9PEZI|nr:uncharacterized protein BKA67DRAFT_655670 [Truncatella angustata]KAH6657396.1 hypothetical protein BKA67DRAFT_655670 [Truncatella angustata]
MASPNIAAGSKKPFDISSLMSPPELPPMDSFARPTVVPRTMDQATSNMRRVHGPNPPLSPPISPLSKVNHSVAIEARNSTPMNDPILYPAHDLSPPQQPLFARDDSIETQRIVEDHVEARKASLFREATPPRQEEYELMLYFKSEVMKKCQENPKSWLQRERAQLLADRRAGSSRLHHHRLQPILPAKPQSIRTQVQRISKPPKPSVRPLQASASVPRPIRAMSPAAQIPRHAVIKRVSVTPDPASRRTAAPSREDKDFSALPDYCPPLNSLPSKANSLKVDWKGAPIDLSSDPQRDLLHPDELALAANLRLDAATYLTSKRRMFIARLNCLKIGKEFRKTDAQQACKIDVNKASKLWTAFDKVGWLEKQWVARFV